jgi:L-ascorbate metabolism protein UlaG (beta-lactamase superfamily)
MNRARMTLTKYGHACVRIRKGGRSLVIDPGVLTDGREALAAVDAVLITHEHFDHFDAARLRGLTTVSPATQVYTCAGVAERLADLGERVHVLTDGDEVTLAGFTLRGVGSKHHYSHPDAPPVDNVGFLIDETVLHPGDALPDLRVPVLLAPGQAPWLTVPDLVTYLRRVRPGRTYAVHDGLLNEWGLHVLDGVLDMEAQRSGSVVRRLTVGEMIDL